MRKCDGRKVPRFECRACSRRFSSQSFRLDYRLKLPRLHLTLFNDFVSKVSHRQSARVHGVSRETVAHRLRLLGGHCREFHEAQLSGIVSGVADARFQLDELETFEHSRRLQPVTVPVLIHRPSYFVVSTATAPLPARGGLKPADREKKEQRDREVGKRRSGSSAAVRSCFEVIAKIHEGPVVVQTDRKKTYVSLLAKTLGDRVVHRRYSSRTKRDYRNPLFPINHTLAMLRDGVSRLVRRSWAASKLRDRLQLHLWVWLAYRNYVRPITNSAPTVTPAMAASVCERMWLPRDLLTWRVDSRPAGGAADRARWTDSPHAEASDDRARGGGTDGGSGFETAQPGLV